MGKVSCSKARKGRLYLGRGPWSWPCPVNKVQKQAHFSWDESCDWFHIRCLEYDKTYIINEYLKAQSEIENELKDKDVLQENGDPIPTVENDLIKTSRPRAAVPEEPAPEETVDSEVGTERVGTQRSNGQSRIDRRTERKTVSKSTAYRF